MSSNFNNAKIINVYYNKGDRKPYDVNGKPIAYIGEEFVGANEATTIRFYLGELLDSGTAFLVAKRANGDTRIDQCAPVAGANPYYEVDLNAWYSEYKGKMTIIFKAYNGTVTFNEANTEITAVSGRIVVSDIFNLEVAYAPLATSTVPPYDPDPEDSWYFALSQKLDKAQSITVTGALPTLTGDVYDDRYFYVENEGTGRLYYINGSTAIEVVFQVGTLKLSATGGAEVTTNTGKVAFDTTYGGFKYTQIRDVVGYIGQDVEYYGKAVGTIAKGDVIQFDGVDGVHFLIKKAVPADVNANPEIILGIAKQGLTNGQFGYILHFGRITGIDLTAYADENYLWFASASANNGELTVTEPTAPNAKILMGVVVDNGASGTLLVRPLIQPSLKDLKDIHITSIANNQVLRWNNTNLRWENTSALTTAETDIDALEGRMTTEEANVDSLESRMTTAEGDIDDIEDGTTIVPKALADQNGNTINTTYLTQSSASATYIPLSQKGANNGVVPLNSSGKISSVYLSGEQDDIQEFANLASFPAVGEADILYVAIDTNKLYRWSGSAYVVISETLALGTTNSTAFPGDRGLALETLTDNIVDGDQALALKNQVIRNTVVGTSPLVVNSIASTTANLTEFQVNGTKVLEVTPAGNLLKNGNLFLHNTGSASTGVGDRANRFGGVSATAVGHLALFSANATANTAVGHASLFDATGGGNTVVGESGGRSITTGANNTFLGNASGFNASQLATASNSTAIGNGSFTDKSNQMVFGNASVSEILLSRKVDGIKVGIGTTTPALVGFGNELTLSGSGFSGQQVAILNLQGTTLVDGNIGALSFFNSTTRIGNIAGARSGADNSGRLVFSTATTATLTEKMTIMPNGNVGIGAQSPSGRLYVAGVGGLSNEAILTLRDTSANGSNTTLGGVAFSSSPGFDFYIAKKSVNAIGYLSFGNANNATEYMSILSSGNVGIGTASPNQLFEVKGSGLTYAKVSSATNGSFRGVGFGIENDATVYGSVAMEMTNGQMRFQTGFAGWGGFQTFFTNGSERMRITDTGNVGIGTSSPAAKLDVTGTVNSLQARFGNTANRGLEILTANTGGSTEDTVILDSKFGSNLGRMVFQTSSTERMKIDLTGNVGINETAPTAQLQVKSGATNRVPLIVDTIASHATNLQEWRVNGGSALSRIDVNGHIRTTRVANQSDGNNIYLDLLTTGAVFNRNVADSNPALIVNLANASSTGHIQVWQSETTAKAHITKTGIFVGQSRPTRTDITANATLALADEGKVLRVNSASNLTITIPLNSSVAFLIDTEIAILRYGTGTVSISPTAGVTLESKAGERKISGQFGSVALKKIGTDEWVLVGSLEA